ncbi:hypothetical protein BC833DRAFT_603249 [Globomyces pollinis-pini]|nr:hypothetical protein BC833DRAFT_603249 [Globomyces pollinis-pini]
MSISSFLLKPTSASFTVLYFGGIYGVFRYSPFIRSAIFKPNITIPLCSIVLHSIWIGSVGSISFMEAWVKFQAPSITKGIALDVGRHVFSALALVEKVLGFVSISLHILRPTIELQVVPSIVIWSHTWFVMPALLHSAQLIIKGSNPPPSKAHVIGIFMEVLKLGTLITITAHSCWSFLNQ